MHALPPMPPHITLRVGAALPAPVSLPHGHIEFVIGDVHGERAHLHALWQYCARHFPTATCTSLGDVIDRGPDSIGCLMDVLQYARAGRLAGTDITFHALPGNHEQMLFAPIFNAEYPDIFVAGGGDWLTPWLHPHGDRRSALLEAAIAAGFAPDVARSVLDHGIARWKPGADGRAPIATFRTIGSLLMLHAGINPTVADPVAWARRYNPLHAHDDDNPLWIREEFYTAPNPWPGGWFVAHGHTFEHRIPTTPDGTSKPPGDLRPEGYRLGLDAGSSATGIVAAAAIRNGTVQVITAHETWDVPEDV
ncbi:metallophosphoesterase [Gluconacetobacter entanii]|uniref:metallophosphoesterase n=1 Tax=Gluconacetobacter entanii TaxID=108528 RepID=UPI001C933B3A|nr:metallophosphoesterase [Gluconacetobacter entanii]MBY4638417.1 metallophosphoesterase [Gluconacetobacter entanii]MCW4581584.1 metallophosphoesterase [Gluconacetobacter entanii]MCW4584994.1 metallophosphoesterase [Gluconacetobacter entanii]MCW4588408.1 metallophosphoesterase [Gluconacetobacter entanii]